MSEKNPFVASSEALKPSFKEILRNQDPRLISAAVDLARSMRALPHDPAAPNTDPRALIVGGFVRDSLRGGHPKDIDIEVYGVSIDRLMQVLEQHYPGRVNPVGKAFSILKINLGDDVEFDISIPRRESKSGKGHKGFKIEGDPNMSIEDAACRRDFSWNALAADPLTGELIDPFGGAEDLQHHILRITDPERFQDDPLRVLRAVQFVARMEMHIEPSSLKLMREMVLRGDMAELPKERITEEIKKLLLKAPRPSLGLEAARSIGLTEHYMPELHAMINVPQEPEWHPEGDVWIHTMMVVDAAAKIIRREREHLSADEQTQIMLGALCHDLGKPSTTEILDGRIRSRGHEEAGEEPTKSFCSRLSFSDAIVTGAVEIAKNHLKPGMLFRELEKGVLDEKSYTNAVRKLLKRIHPVSWRVLLAASESDFRGRTLPGVATNPYAPGLCMTECILKNKLDQTSTQPLLLGRDLVELGFKPGKKMGEIIKTLEIERDKGVITTKEEAIKWVKDQEQV